MSSSYPLSPEGFTAPGGRVLNIDDLANIDDSGDLSALRIIEDALLAPGPQGRCEAATPPQVNDRSS